MFRLSLIACAGLALGGVASAANLSEAELRAAQANPVPAVGQNATDVRGTAGKGLHVLFVGNSVTLHGPRPQIGWTNNFGMAASSIDKDYVHQLAAMIRKECPDASFGLVQVAGKIERQVGHIQDMNLKRDFGWVRDWKPDIITLFYGANVSHAYDTNTTVKLQFTQATENMLNYVDPEHKAKVFHAEGFYVRPVLDAEKRALAKKRGDTFVPMDDIRRRTDVRGRFGHPGDKGMRLIAERFMEYIRPQLKK